MGHILFTARKSLVTPIQIRDCFIIGMRLRMRRNIAAEGWEMTSNEHYNTLIAYLGATVAGGKCKEIGTIYWNSPNTGATNEAGFNGKGAGFRLATTGAFFGLT